MAGRYESILRVPRPEHRDDAFSIRHPPMDRGRRAKLFAAFDALSGFDEAIAEQETIYREREVLSEEMQQELDARLNHLMQIYRARKTCARCVGDCHDAKPFEPPAVTVRCFEEQPGQDGRGQYHIFSGKVVKLDIVHHFLLLSTKSRPVPVRIPLHDITSYSGEIFESTEFQTAL